MAKQRKKLKAGAITGKCLKTVWQTPDWLKKPLRDYWGGRIPFDVATAKDNPTNAKGFWTKEDNALTRKWPKSSFCNPPYGNMMRPFIEKMQIQAQHHGREIITLVSCARWEQQYWQSFFGACQVVCFIRSRVDFVNPETGDEVSGNPFGNMFLGLNIDEERFCDCFKAIGGIFKLRQLVPAPVHSAKPKKGRSKCKKQKTRMHQNSSSSKAPTLAETMPLWPGM